VWRAAVESWWIGAKKFGVWVSWIRAGGAPVWYDKVLAVLRNQDYYLPSYHKILYLERLNGSYRITICKTPTSTSVGFKKQRVTIVQAHSSMSRFESSSDRQNREKIFLGVSMKSWVQFLRFFLLPRSWHLSSARAMLRR